MPVVVTYEGLRRLLAGSVKWEDLRVILYKNDRLPRTADTLADYVEADFSGYDGWKLLNVWTPPAIEFARSFSQSNLAIWTHNGGPVNNLIFGSALVDVDSNLIAAERNKDAPRTVSPLTPILTYQAEVTYRSEFTY
jgi:hypothetical protein